MSEHTCLFVLRSIRIYTRIYNGDEMKSLNKMASIGNISPMPQFQSQTDPTNAGARWTAWIERFETYLIAADIKEGERKRALLLYQAGPEVYKIFRTLPDTGDTKDYAKAKDALTKHFESAKNPIYEIYSFRPARQSVDETIDQFHTRLCTLAKHCEFHDTDFEKICNWFVMVRPVG